MPRHLYGLDVLGDNRPALPPPRAPEPAASGPADYGFLAWLLGAAAGYALWPRHPVLGLLGGGVLAQGGYRVFCGEPLAGPVASVGRAAAGVGGALLVGRWRDSAALRAAGFVGGKLLAHAATHRLGINSGGDLP